MVRCDVILKIVQDKACRYLVINSGTSKSPEFTRQRDKYACGSPGRPGPPWFWSPLRGSKSALPNDWRLFVWPYILPAAIHPALRLPGTTGLGLRPSLACSGWGERAQILSGPEWTYITQIIIEAEYMTASQPVSLKIKIFLLQCR